MAIRTIVFDIGGVLELTPHRGVTDTLRAWERNLGLSPGEFVQRTRHLWSGGNIRTVALADLQAGLCTVLGQEPSAVSALMEDFWAKYLGTPNVELAEYLGGLRQRYRTAMLSNSFVGAREREQDRYRFGDLVDCIVYSHEVGIAKPEPAIYALTCERLGVEPEQVVFLDDYPPYVDAARAAGFRAVLYENNAQAIADIDAILGI